MLDSGRQPHTTAHAAEPHATQRRSVRGWLVVGAVALFGVVTWSLAAAAETGAARTGWFVLALLPVSLLARRHPGAALVAAGFMAMPLDGSRLTALNVWTVLFLVCTSAGVLIWLRRWTGLRWAAASLPFWALSNAGDWIGYAAFALFVGGMMVAAVGPTLPGRRRRLDGAPLPCLVTEPLVAPAPKVYPAARPSRVLKFLTIGFFVLTFVLAAASARAAEPAAIGALSLASLIIATTFAFSNWFSGRVRFRIDPAGLYYRTMFVEQALRWNEVVALSLRYVFLPGMGVRLVYYVVRSNTRECAFPSSMNGAMELKASIEQATGVAWPEPEITPNM